MNSPTTQQYQSLKEEYINIKAENEKLQLLDLMTNEFPKFYRVSKTRIYGPRHTLTYHSSANLMDLHKWILVSLKQIGLTPNIDFDLIISLIYTYTTEGSQSGVADPS